MTFSTWNEFNNVDLRAPVFTGSHKFWSVLWLRFIALFLTSSQSTFIIGDPTDREKISGLIKKEKNYEIAGLLDASSLDRANRKATLERIQRLGVTEVFVAWGAIKNRMFIWWTFQKYGISLHILDTEANQDYSNQGFPQLGEIPYKSFKYSLMTGAGFSIKRAFDFCFSALFFVATSPIYLAIALLIKLDSPGPVFFKQTRIGLHGRSFKVWKFRTMVVNADHLQKELEALNQTKDGVLFKIKDDPRITRIGKILRRYSLDELPQIFNVLLGEMSLIGPRPLSVRDAEKCSEHHFIRNEVMPGVTGLWQVSGRSDILEFEEVVRLDRSYIENWSLWLDLKILLQTIEVVLKKQGAY
ncbi:MAG: sugar transferase [Aphanothece sp. CMT-3BRIN-NPC111]|jgi:exopolysaccharide biosynthesis polyprenyl glycosylphosphotransferase|nr:sugar transferase [Aphanothece sp. CMT-3BRIN-NPC111]